MTKKILIVDDEPDILKIASLRLEKEGYEVITLTSGKAALQKTQEETFDLILLDLFMPEMNGMEVCNALKSEKETKDIPVVLFSASTSPMESEEVKALQFEDFILKPFDGKDLISKVKKIIGEP